MARHITTKQLLNLVDRAERGRLSTEEAVRLRSGIVQLKTDRASLQSRLRVQSRRTNEATTELKALHGLITRSQERGVAQVPVWAVAALLSDEPNREAA
ncbi:hypothetical protein ABT154_21495 [Streptomyces sp. NPDC001728]|uniref:hypothetical protein n=1 Tax=Streptomyces sp. NPDC001728 TaxID=3154396 RepID=UPI0033273258